MVGKFLRIARLTMHYKDYLPNTREMNRPQFKDLYANHYKNYTKRWKRLEMPVIGLPAILRYLLYQMFSHSRKDVRTVFNCRVLYMMMIRILYLYKSDKSFTTSLFHLYDEEWVSIYALYALLVVKETSVGMAASMVYMKCSLL